MYIIFKTTKLTNIFCINPSNLGSERKPFKPFKPFVKPLNIHYKVRIPI